MIVLLIFVSKKTSKSYVSWVVVFLLPIRHDNFLREEMENYFSKWILSFEDALIHPANLLALALKVFQLDLSPFHRSLFLVIEEASDFRGMQIPLQPRLGEQHLVCSPIPVLPQQLTVLYMTLPPRFMYAGGGCAGLATSTYYYWEKENKKRCGDSERRQGRWRCARGGRGRF